MSQLVKICGLTSADMARQAVDAGADMIGLVFFEKSPRCVEPAQAAEIADAVRGEVSIVGLFVNPDMTRLADAIAEVPLTHIQLHGTEKPERVEMIGQSFGLPVIKAIGVASRDDVTAAEAAFSAHADMLLFDAKPPPYASRPGGNGVRFDVDILSDVTGETPWLLSGGLTPENVYDAINAVQALAGFEGVDVSSGVEREPGVKDARLVSDFIGAVRAAASDYMDKDA